MVGRRKLGLVTCCIPRGPVQPAPCSHRQIGSPHFWSAGQDRDHSRPRMSMSMCGGMLGGWKLERQPHDCTTTSSNTIIASRRVWAISIPPSCCTGTGRHSTAACRPGHASCSTRTLGAPNNIQTWCIAATPKHTCTTARTHTHPHRKTVGAAANRALAATRSRGTRLGYRFHR